MTVDSHSTAVSQSPVTNLVSVPEPRGALLLAADQCHPVIAAPAQPLPHVRVAAGAACLVRLLKLAAGGGADTVRKRLVIPIGRVFEHEPPTGLADAAPALPFVAVAANPAGGVEVACESQLLLVWHHVQVRWVHVLGWRRRLFLLQGRVQVGRIGVDGKAGLERVCIAIALEHSKEAGRLSVRL